MHSYSHIWLTRKANVTITIFIRHVISKLLLLSKMPQIPNTYQMHPSKHEITLVFLSFSVQKRKLALTSKSCLIKFLAVTMTERKDRQNRYTCTNSKVTRNKDSPSAKSGSSAAASDISVSRNSWLEAGSSIDIARACCRRAFSSSYINLMSIITGTYWLNPCQQWETQAI